MQLSRWKKLKRNPSHVDCSVSRNDYLSPMHAHKQYNVMLASTTDPPKNNKGNCGPVHTERFPCVFLLFTVLKGIDKNQLITWYKNAGKRFGVYEAYNKSCNTQHIFLAVAELLRCTLKCSYVVLNESTSETSWRGEQGIGAWDPLLGLANRSSSGLQHRPPIPSQVYIQDHDSHIYVWTIYSLVSIESLRSLGSLR